MKWYKLIHPMILGACLVGMIMVLPAQALSGSLRGYRFTQVAKIGDPVPVCGGLFAGDFEVTGLNKRGDLSFIAERGDFGNEGVYAFRNGVLSAIACPGDLAPVGSSATGASINNSGDIAFAYIGSSNLGGSNLGGGGVFRFNKSTGTTSQIIKPGVTSAPGGGVFRGTFFRNAINNGGKIAFTGLIDTSHGRPGKTVGLGVFTINAQNVIANVASPGDPAPGSDTSCDPGGTFDVLWSPDINDRGDVGFGGHVAGEECIEDFPPHVVCDENVYLRRAQTGQIESIAHQGCKAPRTHGKKYRHAFGAQLNRRGDLAFVGDLTLPPAVGDELTIFARIQGVTAPVVLRGDAMPGGGHFDRVSIFQPVGYGITDEGDVYFHAILDTHTDGAAPPDSGLYVKRGSKLRVIARSGDVIPGIGTIADVNRQPPADPPFGFGARMNECGQVTFMAVLTNGDGVILIGTPQGGACDDDDDED